MSNKKEDRSALLDEEGGDGSVVLDKKAIAGLMSNPAALAMMQEKLQGMVGLNSGYYESLPKVVKRRVKALKNNQVEILKIEAELNEAIHQLEVSYQDKFQSLHDKRAKIVSGEYEPKDEECDFPSDIEEEEDDDEEGAQNGKKEEESEEERKKKEDEAKALHGMDENTVGIPEFWLTIFKNVELISANIQEHDEPILAHLTDVKVRLTSQPMGFTLEFHFSPNDYFTDSVLTKHYELKSEVDPEDPFSFEGSEISGSKGCEIHWKKGKNVTVRSVVKKQKHKAKGNVRTVNKEVPNDSFFNFFSPPEVPEGEEELDEEQQDILNADYEIGEVIRQRLVQRAVLYFTGEALEEDDYDDEDEEDEEDDDEEDYDEEEDEDFEPAKASKAGKKGGARLH